MKEDRRDRRGEEIKRLKKKIGEIKKLLQQGREQKLNEPVREC